MRTFQVYVQIDGMKKTFPFDGTEQDAFVTAEYSKALKHFDMLYEEFIACTYLKSNGTVHLYLSESYDGDFVKYYVAQKKYACFSLTERLKCLLNQSGVPFE